MKLDDDDDDDDDADADDDNNEVTSPNNTSAVLKTPNLVNKALHSNAVVTIETLRADRVDRCPCIFNNNNNNISLFVVSKPTQ